MSTTYNSGDGVVQILKKILLSLNGLTPGGSGDVSAPASIADNALVRGDGGAKGIQGSGITADDSNNLSGVGNISSGAVTSSSLTASTALIANGSKAITSSAVTSTELGYLSGATSAVQTQIDGKQPLDSTLTALAATSVVNGFIPRTSISPETFTPGRSITGSANGGLGVVSGDGVAGNPSFFILDLNTLSATPASGDGMTFFDVSAGGFFRQNTILQSVQSAATTGLSSLKISSAHDVNYLPLTVTNGTAAQDSVRSEITRRLTTTDATPTNFTAYTLTAGQVYVFEALVTASRTGGASGTTGDMAAYIIKAAYHLIGGVATITGSPSKIVLGENNAGLDANIIATGATILVQVTGAASNNYTWRSVEILHNHGV